MTDRAIAALQWGHPIVIPTDTVYGLVSTPFHEEIVGKLSALKRRARTQPIALMAFDVDTLLELVPELRDRPAALARALLPAPLTLVLPNPGRRFPWLAGDRPDTIGVRVPELPDVAAAVLRDLGALAATSANLSGGADPARLVDVPAEIRSAVAVAIDGGELLGLPSTVVDLTGPEPQVLREGAVSRTDVLDRVSSVP